MVEDKLGSNKKLQDSDVIVQNLINLRDELWNKRETLTVEERWIVFKINSCLYRKDGKLKN